MQKQQTKTNGTAAQHASAAPQPAPPAQTAASVSAGSNKSLAGTFIRVAYHASDAETGFLTKFLEECQRGVYTAMEAAFLLGNRACGFNCLNDLPDDAEHAKLLGQAYYILRRGDWLSHFLGTLLHAHEIGKCNTPDDVLFHLEEEIADFQLRTETAREVLRRNPQALRNEIREAVLSHPDLFQEGERAR